MERLDVEGVELAEPLSDERLLAVHEALQQFESVDCTAAELVKLRCFAGLNMPEAAEALNLPLRSAERLWAYARLVAAGNRRVVRLRRRLAGSGRPATVKKSWRGGPTFSALLNKGGI